MATTFEECFGLKFALESLGSLDDLHQKMITARETTPDDVGSWLGLHYNYFTINGSTLLQGSDSDRYPDVRVHDLKSFSLQHGLEKIPTLFR